MDQEKQPPAIWGLRILGGGLALGALADGLLRGAAPGINVALWTGALAVTLAALARHQPGGWSRGARVLTITAPLCALGFAWRDSPVLHALDAFALLACLGLAATGQRRESRLERADITDYARGLFRTSLQAVFGGFGLVFRDIPWRTMPRGGAATRQLASVGVGVAVAVPPLLVFGALFAAADPVFRHFLQLLVNWNFADLASQSMTIAVDTLVVGGFLRAQSHSRTAPAAVNPSTQSLGTVEVGVALGLVDLLFLLFVLVQMRFFFGGARTVQVTAGLTYAQYARGDFSNW